MYLLNLVGTAKPSLIKGTALEVKEVGTRVRIEALIAGGWYQIFYAIFVLQIILIDRYSGTGTRKYLWYSKVPVLY